MLGLGQVLEVVEQRPQFFDGQIIEFVEGVIATAIIATTIIAITISGAIVNGVERAIVRKWSFGG